MKINRLYLPLTISICLMLTTAPIRANGVVRDSVGATSSGRGGTNLGHSDNGAILLDNPAAIINITSSGLFEFGVDGLITDLDYHDPENSSSAKVRPGALPELSIIKKSDDGRWAAGLGVFAPAGYSATWDLNNPVLGRQGYKPFAVLGKILPAFAFRVNDRLSLGATFGLAISHAELETPLYLQTGPLMGALTRFDMQATGAAPTWSVGMQYQLSDRTRIGAIYSGETRFGLEGNVLTDVYGLGPNPITGKFDAEVDLVWPRSAGIGLTHWHKDNQRFSVDVLWYDWSHAFDRLDIKLTNSSNPFFTGLLGPTVRDSLPINWKDSVSVRLGYELFYDCCNVFRAGYVHNSRNIPSSTLTPLLPATLEHSLTLGHGTYWGDWRFDFAYQYSFGPDRDVDVSALAGGDFNSSAIEAQAHWMTFSFLKQF